MDELYLIGGRRVFEDFVARELGLGAGANFHSRPVTASLAGKHVVGYLPLSVLAEAETATLVEYTRQPRVDPSDVTEMDIHGAHLHTYVVRPLDLDEEN